MSILSRPLFSGGLALVSLLAAGAFNPILAEVASKASRVTEEAGIDVQARGPIHEGFAQLSPTNPAATPAIAKKPPEAIPELPPDQKPANENVQWLPGYWSWDPDKKDFLWVSGTWRVPPAERRWVPGHWSKTEDGWQWVPGFWAETQQKDLDYVPPPPDSLDNGPSAPSPNESSFYVPGCWLPLQDRFVWRPGFWSPYRTGRVWINSRYSWTPSGYVFLNGYWDYPLQDRGLLFAPVYFNRPLWANSSWAYQPRFAVGFDPLFDSLFVWPGSGSYYFGDFYGRGYRRLGFRPWFAYGRVAHDPLYGYSRWANRNNPNWMSGIRGNYQARNNGTATRPPRTLTAQTALLAQTSRPSGPSRSALQVVAPLGQVNSNVKLSSLSSSQLAAQRTSIRTLNDISRARSQVETNSRAGSGKASGSARSVASLKLPSGVASSTSGGGRAQAGNSGARTGNRSYYSGPRGTNRGYSSAPSTTRPAPTYRAAPTYRSAPTYRAGPSYRPAPTYRPAPSYRPSYRPAPSYRGGGSSYRGGGSSYRGGGGRGGGGGGHRR